MLNNTYYIYILTNWNNNVLYIGMTNDLKRRVFEHQKKCFPGFTRKYNVTKLVYFEHTYDANSAIQREKTLKKWRRSKKDALIESLNPSWRDLSENWD